MCAPPPPGSYTLLLLVHHQTERPTDKVMNNWLVAVIVSTVVAGAAIVVLAVAISRHRSHQLSKAASQDALDNVTHNKLSEAELGLRRSSTMASWSPSRITLLTSESGKRPSHQEVVNLPNPSKQGEDASMHDPSYPAIGIPLKPNRLEDFSHEKPGWIHHESALRTGTCDTPSHDGAEGNRAKAAIRPSFISRFRPARREPDRASGASVSQISSDAQRLAPPQPQLESTTISDPPKTPPVPSLITIPEFPTAPLASQTQKDNYGDDEELGIMSSHFSSPSTTPTTPRAEHPSWWPGVLHGASPWRYIVRLEPMRSPSFNTVDRPRFSPLATLCMPSAFHLTPEYGYPRSGAAPTSAKPST
ncbi:uncharacterized protein LAESUDRAFT_317470 [Laetiporus sulphureus 93-53]|uniref:Uncharacterized protein n=1 Tax=Laetiporus sulphureus 93-53 TaxID=1314785 RepID=A0A165D0N1_9APHY|nr:uncharacterized protein LAESUDRAFT_317470 [Laetiporus sulphureus 93-53]KZT03899.1 hypothetical protein LAESUDRAFT_317470 [Laetiporus sulphureus 93-53]